MLILFWVGSFWREDLAPHPAAAGPVPLAPRDQPSLGGIMAATIVAVVTVAVWPVAASRLEGTGPYPPPVLQEPPPAGGWQPVAGRLTTWTPRFVNPGAQIDQAYAEDARRVGLYIGYYRNQRQGAKLITSQNTLVPRNDSAWRNAGETHRTLVVNNKKIPSIETKLRDRSTQLLVWHWFWVDGQYTVNPYWAKLLQAKSKLLGRGDDGAVVIVYTEIGTDGMDGKAAAGRLQDFVSAMLPAATRSLQNVR
jgi:EpsI family protein